MDTAFRKYLRPLALYFLCIALYYPILAQEAPQVEVSSHGEIGENATLMCKVSPISAEVVWSFADKPVQISNRIIQTNGTTRQTIKESGDTIEQYQYKNLTIVNATYEDAGNYTCDIKTAEGETRKVPKILDLTFPGKFVKAEEPRIIVNLTDKDGHSKDITMKCIFELYKTEPIIWTRDEEEPQLTNSTRISQKQIESTYTIHKVGTQNNGTYVCNVWDAVNATNVSGKVHVIVYDKPRVKIENVIAISKSELYLNWTTEAFNSKILNYVLSYNTGDTWKIYNDEKIATNSTSFVIKGFNKSTDYTLRLEVNTECGENKDSWKPARTLDEDPVFVPNISINGFSATSVTIGWAPPPENIAHLIHYYILEARKKDGDRSEDPRTACHERDPRNLPYMFGGLDPHSTYVFRVRACREFITRQCGNWSEEMEAATLDGIPGKPSNVSINCSSSQMFLTWQPPDKPNAEIKGYTMELTGYASYKDRTGQWKKVTFGPLSRFMSNDSRSARFDDLQPNTNFTVRLSAMTRTRRRGDEYTAHCTSKVAPPDAPPRPRWRKIMENERYLFKMYLPKVSERNGPICCYRVYMVRLLPHFDVKNLKSQRQLDIIDYEEAHAAQPVLGAYITDVFSNDNFPIDGEIIMGDDRAHFNRSDSTLASKECGRCLQRPPRAPEPTTTQRTTTTTTEDEDVVTTDPPEDNKEKRAVDDFGGDYRNNVMMKDPQPLVEDYREAARELKEVAVKDGPLDSEANYTLFVELIPGRVEEESMFSEYINQLMPAPSPVVPAPSTALEIALQATCAVAALVLLAMIIFCVMQSRRSRKLPPHAHLEMNPIQSVIRYVARMGRPHPVSTVPQDMPPIAKDDLAAAYAERHADSDYGFQKEFELLQMLSERFPDRSTHASEARENLPKNRYPDIKAYDQTRVKLSPLEGVPGSDYINANYVWGYNERKKFICAQGPTDTTVNDFWRMIWEHGLELIVMLTNLEEYSKVKCSKYWPDELRGSRAFGAVQVQHVTEKRYSDYIVRELKITKMPTNSEGQPIVENNGVSRRNGDIKEASDSVPTSPREQKEVETRTVKQYHFLMWKDFAAPEHPHSILKFIKRVNEAWSNMVGRPVVVHCSAGVGRTGTLVALDCLLEQLKATGQAVVFNTISELRHQRNFLVQSQKQYVFVYRALVEYAHYGDTEITASRLKSAIDRLRNTPEGADKCLMEIEFEKMIDSPVVEAVKSCSAGLAEELRSRNRSADCLPYDRNRVMLTPIPGRDYSTYINASFIEAYDNSEGFIITQDPLPNTVFDFWRMVSEQSISTIVMLSELGEGKCPRYWDDGTAQYEHMSVQYDESESCPYYTRRQFRVTNNKSGHVTSVRQLQYQGWPTAPGHVPEVTRGLAELADACAPTGDLRAPMLVHCLLGTERSALFVALCILICQLRTERRVDVNALARKVRAQRSRTIDTFLQYEFLHRAILNYAELHNLLEDS